MEGLSRERVSDERGIDHSASHRKKHGEIIAITAVVLKSHTRYVGGSGVIVGSGLIGG
jgi:hypothetical protein